MNIIITAIIIAGAALWIACVIVIMFIVKKINGEIEDDIYKYL